MADYDFRTLSPTDFELLIRDLLAAEHRWRLEAFGHGRDGGVDLRASSREGKVIVQCKHYLGSTFSDLRTSARKEVPKMNKEQPDRYLFATSQDLNRTQKDTLAQDLEPWITDTADLLTRIDINFLIARHPHVERQHFKLWLASTTILERIVHSGIWARSEALLEDVRDRVKLYVHTNSFEKARRILEERHLAVLSGPPGVGKSMLAEMLALTYWNEEWQIVPIEADIDEGWDAYKKQQKQVFLYDDFLGQTDVSERRATKDNWLIRFMDRVARDPSKRFIMTTRSQILRQTALVSEPIARTDFRVIECIIQIEDYGPQQRARMLYNHLYFSTLPREVVRGYSSSASYWRVVNHENFSPRIIELVIRRSHKSAEALTKTLNHTLDHPLDLWGIVFNTALSDISQRTTLALASFALAGARTDRLKRLVIKSAKPTDYTNALRALEGTFIKIDKRGPGGTTFVSYANPSVRDFVLAFINEEPDYLATLLAEAQQLRQVSVLLEYAGSKVAGRYKFPRCAGHIRSNQEVIKQKIFELIATEKQESDDAKHPRQERYQNITLPLIKLLKPALELMRGSFDEILGHVNTWAEDHTAGYMDADDWSLLTIALMERIQEDPNQSHGDLQRYFDKWGDSLYTIDEVREYENFFDEYGSILEQHFYAKSMFDSYVESGLRQELDSLSSNRVDRETEHQWVDDVEQTAKRHGIYDALEREIDSTRNSIDRHYEEDEFLGSQPTSGAGYGFSRQGDVSIGDRAVIEGMFRELS